METSGKVNEMVESAGYTMEAFGNMSSVMESMIQELDEISVSYTHLRAHET